MGRTTTNIVGSSFYKNAGNWIARLRPNQPLILRREPENQYDKNAIAVYIFEQKLGHLSRGVAKDFAPIMDSGVEVSARKSTQFLGTGVIELRWADDVVRPSEAVQTPDKPFFPKVDL